MDSTAEGPATERLRPTRLDLGGRAAPARVQLRDFRFYRSGINEGKMLAMAADSLRRSSTKWPPPTWPASGERLLTTRGASWN